MKLTAMKTKMSLLTKKREKIDPQRRTERKYRAWALQKEEQREKKNANLLQRNHLMECDVSGNETMRMLERDGCGNPDERAESKGPEAKPHDIRDGRSLKV